MSSNNDGRIVCVACNRAYRWKPELAGKRVRCHCGAVMTLPADRPAQAETASENPGQPSDRFHVEAEAKRKAAALEEKRTLADIQKREYEDMRLRWLKTEEESRPTAIHAPYAPSPLGSPR